MSHFTVMVIGEDIDSQLYPYDGQTEDQAYLEFKEADLSNADEEFAKHGEEGETKEGFMASWYGYDVELDKYGYWHNPNAKWDWYQIGGRWAGSLLVTKQGQMDVATGKAEPNFSWGWDEESKEKVLSEARVDSTLKKYVDIEAMEKPLRESASKCWDEWHAGIKDLPEEDKEKRRWIDKNLGWMTTIQDIERITTMSKEEYVACMSNWAPYALLWNGKWYEKGTMGWFAISTNEESNWSAQFKELWKEIPEDAQVTMVDCHI